MDSKYRIIFWISCISLILSVISIGWSLILLFCVSDMLAYLGLDLINSVDLLSGLVMLPTNLFILHSIVNEKKINYKTDMVRCRLWTCIGWIILINVIGLIMCGRRLYDNYETSHRYIRDAMKYYRSNPVHKRFIDNLQWILKCCGLYDYNDWFTQDWHDNSRDYDWGGHCNQDLKETDSVPLSCCKSGSCVSSFLKELGTSSINTCGCGNVLSRIILTSMCIHFFLFIIVIILKIILLRYLCDVDKKTYFDWKNKKFRVNQIMAVKKHFMSSSKSHEEDSDDETLDQ